MRTFVIPALVVVAAGAEAGCLLNEGCTDVGCVPLYLPLGSVAAEQVGLLDGAWVQLCRSGACVDAPILQVPEPGTGGSVYLSPEVEGLYVEAYLQRGRDGELSIEFRYFSNDARRFRDGDVFELAVIRADEEPLLGRSYVVPRYQVHMPNGPHCEPTCWNPVGMAEL